MAAHNLKFIVVVLVNVSQNAKNYEWILRFLYYTEYSTPLHQPHSVLYYKQQHNSARGVSQSVSQ